MNAFDHHVSAPVDASSSALVEALIEDKAMQDRRDLRRRHLMFHLRVYDADTRREIGALTDVSPDGMMVTGERRMTLGQKRRMYMELPRALSAHEHIEFSAVVAWSSNEVNPAFYDTGFRDLVVDPEDRAALIQLMEEFDLKDV